MVIFISGPWEMHGEAPIEPITSVLELARAVRAKVSCFSPLVMAHVFSHGLWTSTAHSSAAISRRGPGMMSSIGGGYITTLELGPCVIHADALSSPQGTEQDRVRGAETTAPSLTDDERVIAGGLEPAATQGCEVAIRHSFGKLVRTAPGIVMHTGGGFITNCESGVVDTQHGVEPQTARGPEDLVTSALEHPSNPLVRQAVSVSTRVLPGDVARISPGRVSLSEGGCITTFASGHEVTHGVVTHFTPALDILPGCRSA